MNYRILEGDNRDTLKTLEDNSVDSIVTDPPYGIDFLGKDWDANTGALETYTECFRVLKPGGYILAFSAARTYHHLAITLEQAGFEIRDQLMWLYSQGFPKGQYLKPAHEPIALATKGKAGDLFIDSCRVGWERIQINQYKEHHYVTPGDSKMNGAEYGTRYVEGRHPSNVIGEVKGYQKFYYCPKVSKQERMEYNNHPTVKPVALMRYLIKLVTPPNSTVLDPFNGSGSTGMAATELGHTYIGCELDPDYVEITKKRIEAWNDPKLDNLFTDLFDYE